MTTGAGLTVISSGSRKTPQDIQLELISKKVLQGKYAFKLFQPDKPFPNAIPNHLTSWLWRAGRRGCGRRLCWPHRLHRLHGRHWLYRLHWGQGPFWHSRTKLRNNMAAYLNAPNPCSLAVHCATCQVMLGTQLRWTWLCHCGCEKHKEG